MNEQALQDSYNLFKSKGYGKSFDDYKNLLRTNSNALNDSYALFKSSGYGKSIDDYKVLMGVGGSTPVVKKKRVYFKGYGITFETSRLTIFIGYKVQERAKAFGFFCFRKA